MRIFRLDKYNTETCIYNFIKENPDINFYTTPDSFCFITENLNLPSKVSITVINKNKYFKLHFFEIFIEKQKLNGDSVKKIIDFNGRDIDCSNYIGVCRRGGEMVFNKYYDFRISKDKIISSLYQS